MGYENCKICEVIVKRDDNNQCDCSDEDFFCYEHMHNHGCSHGEFVNDPNEPWLVSCNCCGNLFQEDSVVKLIKCLQESQKRVKQLEVELEILKNNNSPF